MPEKKETLGNFRDLGVYKKALNFRKDIYEIVLKFPPIERFNMSDQLRRASTSIPANIAEGNTNFYYKKEISFLNIALGSVGECRPLLDMALDEGYMNKEEYRLLDGGAEELIKMIIGLINYLKARLNS